MGEGRGEGGKDRCLQKNVEGFGTSVKRSGPRNVFEVGVAGGGRGWTLRDEDCHRPRKSRFQSRIYNGTGPPKESGEINEGNVWIGTKY